MELKENKKGIIGVVADIIKVEKKYEVAIETALGGNIQNIVTDTETTAKEIIEYLKKNKYGRATFLPLSSMTKKTGFNNEDVFSDKGVLGLACDLVEIKKEYEGVTKYLLGKVVVVDTIDNAIALERKYRYSLRIVTLEGEYLNIGGSISGGAFKNNSNLLGRRREIEELENKLKDLKNEKENLDKNLIENRSKTSVLNDELDKINKALQEQNIAKNTLELNLKQAKDRKNNIDTGANRGTAYHRIFELMDLNLPEYTVESVNEMINGYVKRGLIDKAGADCINENDVIAFSKTDLFERMKQAHSRGELFREQKFLLGKKACEVNPNTDSEELVVIQGIIDVCFIENGRYYVVDYKTDKVRKMEQLYDKYSVQLDYYKEAIEQITGKKVEDEIIYSVTLGDEISFTEHRQRRQ